MPRIPKVSRKLINYAAKGGKRFVNRVMDSEESEAAEKLIGMPYKHSSWGQDAPERYIKGVTKHADGIRMLEFEDGTFHPETTAEIHRMVTMHQAELGRQPVYAGASQEVMESTALDRGIANLQKYVDAYRTGRFDEMTSKKTIRSINRDYQKTLKKSGMKVDPYVLVEYEGLLMPFHKLEANALAEAGIVRFHRWQGSARDQIKKTRR